MATVLGTPPSLPPPRMRKTRRLKVGQVDTTIRDLPLGVWRIPPNRWILSLRKHDGMREVRTLTGSILHARERRDSLMATGRYTMAWLMEASEGREAYRRNTNVRKVVWNP